MSFLGTFTTTAVPPARARIPDRVTGPLMVGALVVAQAPTPHLNRSGSSQIRH